MKYLIPSLMLLILARSAPGQTPPSASAEAAALRRCTALADSGRGAEAEASGKTAETLYLQRVGQNPRDVDALVGAARAKSQCLVPAANFLRQGELSSDAIDLLDRALEMQPDHWLARYVLASIAYRSPAFLGRGKRAAKELDELLRMQGDRTDDPMFARVFALRGMQLSRQGKADSARALWLRGAALFPADAELRELVQRSSSSEEGSAATAAVDTTAGKILEVVRVTAPSAPAKAPLPSVKDVTRTQ